MHEFQVFSVKPVIIYKNRLLVKFLECMQEEFSLESDMVKKLGSNTLKSGIRQLVAYSVSERGNRHVIAEIGPGSVKIRPTSYLYTSIGSDIEPISLGFSTFKHPKAN